MSERDQYENPALWTSERFLTNPKELSRFEATAAMIPGSSTTMLDVGCGNGAFMRFLEDRSTPLTMTGLERSEAAIRAAVCQSPIQSGSITEMPFEDRSFDLVSALEVIEHLPYGVFEPALRELERVARTHILISVPYREARHRVCCPYCGCRFNPYYHMRNFDDDRMNNLFKDFRPANTRKVEVLDPIFDSLLTRVYWSLVYPSNTLCPQCGYSSARTNAAGEGHPSLVNRALSVIPKRKHVYWIVVLYERAR